MTNRKFKCILSNDGPLLEECKKQVEDMGLSDVVIFAGFRKDIKILYTGATFILILPSTRL